MHDASQFNISKPSVVFSNTSKISSKIFNYNDLVNNFVCINDYSCKCSEHSDFINADCENVVTGDMNIIKCESLMNLLLK